MRLWKLLCVVATTQSLCGCVWVERLVCEPHCQTATRNSSSVVDFLYPQASVGTLPPQDAGDQNDWSLGYPTIVGAFVLKGDRHDISTLVDLADVDPMNRSLVLRAGGVGGTAGGGGALAWTWITLLIGAVVIRVASVFSSASAGLNRRAFSTRIGR